ncbi:hypothetical protein QYE76_062665 [Lolium multiflorum]|uniref:DUF4218 domain-containing protein n=1 Tax=Lolium multiflorum TaxID=4521 RepID=A0AAD8S472_LOLMU|nr:hypothetical protein QYE76_062665 [Lolium multiflorum]
MHTVKNVAEFVFHTCLNIPGKSKDNVKARVDVPMLCDREKLHMKRPIGCQKNWFKPHANFCLDSIQQKEAFTWLKYVVMFPDGYCSNMSNLSTGQVTGLKSHDYHIWIQRLMPVVLRGYIPEKVWRVFAQLSHFFRTLCAKEICPKVIAKLQDRVPELLCNLEMIFPPGFFTPMEHLIVHLANEALLGGPVQFRWQFCIEREVDTATVVCPEWAEPHKEAWEELIRARWLKMDEEFAVVSRRNIENRGTGDTHCAGNRDFNRYKGKVLAEATPGVVLHDPEIYDKMRTKTKPNPALPQP